MSRDKRERPSKESLEVFEKQAVRAYGESGLFSKVAIGTGMADLKAEVEVSGEEGQSNGFLRLLNGMTLTLIPVPIEYSPTMKTVFRDSQGNTLGTIKKSEDVSIWMGFLLAFAMPFRSIDVNGVIFDLYRATISDAHLQGFL